MVIYNVTVKANRSIAPAWLAWLKEVHIPAIIDTGCFTHATVLHLFEADDDEGITYAIQYHAANQSSYNHYIENFADIMRQRAMEKWGNKYIAFQTVMKVVH